MARIFLTICVIVLIPALVWAQDMTSTDVAGAQAAQTSNELLIDLGFGKVEEDWFLTTRAQFGIGFPVPKLGCGESSESCSTQLRFNLQVPVRWRVIDEDPQNDQLIREEDWDEVSDYFKILRVIEYGRRGEPLHVRLGELGSLVIGHGTIMNGYYNVVTVDNFSWGLNFDVNTSYGGVEFMLDDFVNPAVVGGRVYARPWGFIDPSSFWHRLAVGFSLITDVDAPLELETDQNGDIVVNPGVAPEVADSQFTGIMGFDVELSVVDESWIHVMPYMDFNIHAGQGPGYHLGTMFNIWPWESLGFSARAEFRWLSNNYLPDYYGPLYKIDRYQYFGWGVPLPAPKLRVAASQDRGSVLGFYGDLGVNVMNIVTASGAYQDYQGPDNGALWLRLDLRQVGPVKLGAMYYKQNFDGADEIFELDGALGVLEGRVMVFGPIFVQGQYSRLWKLRDTGVYETVDDWNVGAGAAFSF